MEKMKKLAIFYSHISPKNGVKILRYSVYGAACFHTLVAFLIVALIITTATELINDSSNLATFWVVMFVHLVGGFLCFVGTFMESRITLRIVAFGLVALQVAVLIIMSKVKTSCRVKALPEDEKRQIFCTKVDVIILHILLPVFLSTLIFAALIVAFTIKLKTMKEQRRYTQGEERLDNTHKNTFQFNNITVIVEEVL